MAIADTLPSPSDLNQYHAKGDFLDTFSVSLKGRPDLQSADIRVLADHLFRSDIGWMGKLIDLRDVLVKPFGLKTTADLLQDQRSVSVTERGPGDRIAFFKIYEVGPDEILLGEDDWHQDFRLSIFRQSAPDPRLFAATCCKRHNVFGYAYLALILPFHKKIAKAMLDACVERPVAAH